MAAEIFHGRAQLLLDQSTKGARLTGEGGSEVGVRADDAAEELEAGYEELVEAAREDVRLGKDGGADA